MKKLLLMLIMYFPLISYSQEIPKRASNVIVKTQLSAKENFSFAIKTILGNDLIIDTKDAELGYIKTQQTNNKDGIYFYNILCSDNQISISGMSKTGYTIKFGSVSSSDDFEKIENRGMNGSFFKKMFNNMNEFAKKFNLTLSYK
ncbi:MAG: hypothetical protein V4541_05390 [Bacteroidota bacterium]